MKLPDRFKVVHKTGICTEDGERLIASCDGAHGEIEDCEFFASEIVKRLNNYNDLIAILEKYSEEYNGEDAKRMLDRIKE